MIEQMTDRSLLMARQIIFFATEQLTRACLHLDPGTRARLQTIAGKVIELHIRDTLPLHPDGIRVFLTPTGKGIDLTAEARTPADASLGIYARDLLALLRKPSPELNNITIEGDHEVLLSLLDIIRGFDIDWEAAIAPVTGDIIAHQVGKNIRASEKWFAQSFKEARRLAEEYINEELPLARQAGPFKSVFDQMEKMKSAGDAVRGQVAAAVMKSPFFKSPEK